jgi:hypothetical protein
VSTATETDTDVLAAMDWEPEYACEHPHHADGPTAAHDEGPATHWAETDHECFGPVGVPYPVCARYAADTRGRRGLICHWCGAPIDFDAIRILGPINAA